ncbi:hypothetical protein L2735_03855 [Shewanella olleyana]|uniref:hypothetical protein n=1 Tax=Shewanella olleyana TaxID=135626 RepID=UPI00200F1756|nr:hypothetical protein [Shewanella olleyana]MCL1065942.1 hypothetical protein [Shewanella olleyana]
MTQAQQAIQKSEQAQMQFEQAFQPYLHLRLGAFENMKIVAGVLSSMDKTYATFEVVLATEKPIYIVDTEFGVISCGRTNGYEEAIKLLVDEKKIDLSEARTVNVPVLSLQQISFMCVETSHFDHC